MRSSPAEDEFLEYYCPSGSVVCRVLYQLGPMIYVQFRCKDCAGFGYRECSNYPQVALFPEHLRPADPRSPGVVGFAQALASEEQHLSDRRHQANGQSGTSPIGDKPIKHRAADDAAKALPGPQGNGVKPLSKPKKTPARQHRAKANGEDVHSLKPVRSIAGLTIADFLYSR